jgi:hypothetical protein
VHLRALGGRDRPRHDDGLGRQGGLAVAAAGRADRPPCLRRRQDPCRRYAAAGAAPGTGRTATGRIWVYVRDDRTSADATPPAAAFFYSPDRKGARPAAHLKGFSGFLQADAYAGYDRLYEGGRIVEVGCWAHARRKVFDVFASTRSPIAEEALAWIKRLYAIEARIRGRPPDLRHAVRQAEAAPLLVLFRDWLIAQRAKLPPRGGLSLAWLHPRSLEALIRYTRGWKPSGQHGGERAARRAGPKNFLFAGSDAGGENAAILYTLIETGRAGIRPDSPATCPRVAGADGPVDALRPGNGPRADRRMAAIRGVMADPAAAWRFRPRPTRRRRPCRRSS